MQERSVTYQLHVNTAQYQYLVHEIQRTRQIYRWFCNIIQNDLRQVQQKQHSVSLSEQQLLTALHTYCKKYAPMLLSSEIAAIGEDLLLYQKKCHVEVPGPSCDYRCKNITTTLYWRNIKLPLKLDDGCYWKLEPIVFHWEIIGSSIWYHKHKIWLTLHFQNPL